MCVYVCILICVCVHTLQDFLFKGLCSILRGSGLSNHAGGCTAKLAPTLGRSEEHQGTCAMFPCSVYDALAQCNYHRSAKCESDEDQPYAAGVHGSLVVPTPRGAQADSGGYPPKGGRTALKTLLWHAYFTAIDRACMRSLGDHVSERHGSGARPRFTPAGFSWS